MAIAIGWALAAVAINQVHAMAQSSSVVLPQSVHETSGLTISSRGAQWLWTVNDSDNGPELFEISTQGKLGRVITVKGATNVDWEAIGSQLINGKRFLYIGDVGGNSLPDRREFVIYRVAEPVFGAGTSRVASAELSSVESKAIKFRYDGGQNFDCESICVVPGEKTVFLITKPRTRKDIAELYRIDKPDPSHMNTAVRVRSIDLHGFERGVAITDMCVNNSGTELSFLSDNKCYTFKLTRPYDLKSFDAVHPNRVIELELRQAEGVCYGSKDELFASSESRDHHPAVLTQLRKR